MSIRTQTQPARAPFSSSKPAFQRTMLVQRASGGVRRAMIRHKSCSISSTPPRCSPSVLRLPSASSPASSPFGFFAARALSASAASEPPPPPPVHGDAPPAETFVPSWATVDPSELGEHSHHPQQQQQQQRFVVLLVVPTLINNRPRHLDEPVRRGVGVGGGARRYRGPARRGAVPVACPTPGSRARQLRSRVSHIHAIAIDR